MKEPQYQYKPEYLSASDPDKFKESELKTEELVINLGPQHPSTHGVLRLEVKLDGEEVVDVAPHLGYLHRCFEKHAENLPYNQIIPFIDRMDYLAAMNSEHIYAEGVEKILGIKEKIPPRVQYIRVVVSELNRLASHFVALGTYGVDLGATTPFLWLMRDREHILRMLEWVSGARMLYNYIWIGGLYYDLPLGFEEKCEDFINYLIPKIREFEKILTSNVIFVQRTANVGILPLDSAINYGITGPMLRASGLRYDLRKVDDFSVYKELDFDVPIGEGKMGTKGDCWDRTIVRVQECHESCKIILQACERLKKEHKRTPDFDPQSAVPKRIKLAEGSYYFRGEGPKGELGYHIVSDGKTDVPVRCKVRAPSFINLAVVSNISKGLYLSDLIAIIGSIDIVMGEVDR